MQSTRRGLQGGPLSRMRLLTLVGALLWTLPGGAGASSHNYRCQAVVEAKLQEVGVGQDDIRAITVVPTRSSGSESKPLTGYSTWVALKSCKGSVVVDLSRICNIEQTYTHGACRIEGVKG